MAMFDRGVFSTPAGGRERYLVKMDGTPFASFPSYKEAEAYKNMMLSCTKGGKKGDGSPKAFCATREWSITDRG